ncbi:phage head-tail connector protein [Enterococcus sp.]|uniref:phage head-tail connector protein n=1 Tax=Enterococcus sp. TaxID=35783 RepID=UPI003C781EA0
MTETPNQNTKKSDALLSDFKARMKIFHSSEDDYLKSILEASTMEILQLCGEFDVLTYPLGKELIFERSRYAYNDQLEFFYPNFQESILNISFDLMVGETDGN